MGDRIREDANSPDWEKLAIPKVGDRIREDANSPDWEKKVESLITEGEFIEIVEKYGETFWKAKLNNGKFALMNPEDTVIVERAAIAVLVEKEISKSLLEPLVQTELPLTPKKGDRIWIKKHKTEGVFIAPAPLTDYWEIEIVVEKMAIEKFFHPSDCEIINPVLVDKKCLPTSTCLEALEPSPLQPETLEKSRPSPMLIPAKMRKKSTKRTSLKSRSTQTSETIIPQKELTCLQEVFRAQEPVLQEVKQDLTTPNLQCGLNISDVLTKDDPDLSSSKIPQDYSIAEWEQSFKAYPRSGTMRSGRLSPLQCLEVPKKEKGCLSLPTLTTGLGSSRNAGATKCEKFARDKGLFPNTHVLNPQMMALMFAFPMDWTKCLLESPKESEDATMPESCTDEPSISTVPPSPLNESCTCTEFSVNNIDAKLSYLLEQRERLIASGASPQGVWINCGKVPNRDFKQAVWKSDKPQPQWGDKKSQYIGKFGGDEHLSAIAQHRAGQELRKVEKEIKKLQNHELFRN